MACKWIPCFKIPCHLVLPLLALLAAASGCSQAPQFDVATVNGKFSVDGKPLNGGRVMFAPVGKSDSLEAGRPGFGDISQDGSFVISTYTEGDGAVVGEHWVYLINNDPDSAAGRRIRALRVTVPERKTVLPDQPNNFSIDLSSQEIKKYGRFK